MSGQLDPSQRQKIMETVSMEVEMQKLKLIMESVQDKCFKLCVTKPGSSLGSSEQKCLGQCMDRFLDARNIVEKAYISRIQSESGSGGF